MPGSYWQLFYHFVWTTNQRAPLITPEIRDRLFRYIRKKCEEHRARVYAIGGIKDHIHLLVSLPPDIALSKFVADLKGASSHFVNHELLGRRRFYWQEGYGVLSIAAKDVKRVVDYIEHQEDRHRDREIWLSMEKCEVE